MKTFEEIGTTQNTKSKAMTSRNFFTPNVMTFTDESVKSKNKEISQDISKMASDQASYTGPQQGFYAKFGSKNISK
jgi:hypothetical protein